MKTILTILAILSVSAIFAQTPKKMVLIENYSQTAYEKMLLDKIRYDATRVDIYRNDYSNSNLERTRDINRISNDLFVVGNFNTVNTTVINMINIPRPSVENNNYEYVKTTQFNPNKTLQEILRNE